MNCTPLPAYFCCSSVSTGRYWLLSGHSHVMNVTTRYGLSRKSARPTIFPAGSANTKFGTRRPIALSDFASAELEGVAAAIVVSAGAFSSDKARIGGQVDPNAATIP